MTVIESNGCINETEASEHFNGLTPEHDELLTCLSEECAEVIMAICKTQRHGLASYHPEDLAKVSNRQQIARELGDVIAVAELLMRAGVIDAVHVDRGRDSKLRRIGRYLHHCDLPVNADARKGA